MKKFLVIVLAALLSFQLFSFAANAEAGTISLSTVQGQPGETVVVEIDLSANPGIACLLFKVYYDSSALTLLDAENTELLAGLFTTSQTIDVNPYVLLWTNASNCYGSGTIAKLTFRINQTATEGSYPIYVLFEECYSESLNDVFFTSEHNAVNIVSNACNHIWDDGTVAIPAGCETEGSMVYTCTLCGVTLEAPINATGHQFGEWSVAIPASCTELGTEARECSCGATERREIPATGHSFDESGLCICGAAASVDGE